MPGDIQDVLRLADRVAIERGLQDLETQREKINQEIALRREFLEILNRWAHTPTDAHTSSEREPEPGTSGSTSTVSPLVRVTQNTRRPATPQERRDAIVAVMSADPNAEWSTDDLRSKLDEAGISFEGGTPLKGHLFRMAQKGTLERPRQGVYKLSPPNGNGRRNGPRGADDVRR